MADRAGPCLRIGLAVAAILALGPVIAACQTEPGYYRSYAWDDDGYDSGWGYSGWGYVHDRSDDWRYRRHDWNDRRHDDWRDRDDNPWPRRVDRDRRHDRNDHRDDHDRGDRPRFASPREDRSYGGGHQDNRPIIVPQQWRNERD